MRRLKPTPDRLKGLRGTNQDIYDTLVLGTTITKSIDGDSKSYSFRYPVTEQDWMVGSEKAHSAVTAVWSAAFAQGRILVFREAQAAWQIVPPHLWRNSPPIWLPSLDQKAEVWKRKKWRELSRERKQRANRAQAGISFLSDAFILGGDEPWLEPTELGSDEGIQGRQTDQQNLAFLLSRDLPGPDVEPPQAVLKAVSESLVKKGPRSLEKMDRPLVDQVEQRILEGEFQSTNQAVKAIYLENPAQFPGHGCEDSKVRRISGRVRERLRELQK